MTAMKTMVQHFFAKGSQRLTFCAVLTWAGFLLFFLVKFDSCEGFLLPWTPNREAMQQYTLSNRQRGVVEGVPFRSTLSHLSMGFFDEILTRFSPWRKIESSNVVFWISDGARGGNRRFFDPPSPLVYPLNRTSEIIEISAVKTNSAPLPEVQSEEAKRGQWTADDKRAFLIASLQGRNVLPPSQLSTVLHMKENESLTLPTSTPQHQFMSSIPSTDIRLEGGLEERQKRAWVEMVLDPNRYHRIRSSTKGSTQVISSQIMAKEREKVSQKESRFSSTIVQTIEVGRTTSELDFPSNLNPYLRNREAINKMLQLRSSLLKNDQLEWKEKPHKALDDSAAAVRDRSLLTSSISNNLRVQNTSEDDLQKTRSIIRQFHSSLRSDRDTVGSVKPVLQNRDFTSNQRVPLIQNKIPIKESRRSSDISPKSIRMKLPITDCDADDDGVDPGINRNLNLRDVMQKASLTSSTESQEDRSKKWGIDMSKFT